MLIIIFNDIANSCDKEMSMSYVADRTDARRPFPSGGVAQRPDAEARVRLSGERLPQAEHHPEQG